MQKSRKVRILDAMVQRLTSELESWTDSGSEQGRLYCWPFRGTYTSTEGKNIVFATLQTSLGSLIAQRSRKQGNLELISLISGSVGSSLFGT